MALSGTPDWHDMQGNEIGVNGARELARALEHNTCITHLNVAVRLNECDRKHLVST